LEKREILAVQLLEKITRRNSIGRFAIVSAIPFFLLAIDFFFSPIWIDTHVVRFDTGLNDLFQNNIVYLGIFRGNDVFVSLDDIRDPEYLVNLEGRPTALVVSVFVSPDDKAVPGALVSAVRSRLQHISPDDQIRLKNISEQLRGSNEGRAVDFPLHIPSSKQAEFPVDALLVITLPYSSEAKDALREGIRRAMLLAETKSVLNVIIPCIGIKWRNSKGATDTSLPVFFNTLFNAIPVTSHRHRLYLSLYKSWPTFELQDVISALDSSWQSTPVEEAGTFPIHHRDTRLVELFLLPCLISCGMLARLTVRNVLIIVIAFLSIGVGAKTAIDLITTGQSPQLKLIIQLVYLTALYVGFPFIVKWNPKDIFEEPIEVDC
jgi:hypothetical protein